MKWFGLVVVNTLYSLVDVMIIYTRLLLVLLILVRSFMPFPHDCKPCGPNYILDFNACSGIKFKNISSFPLQNRVIISDKPHFYLEGDVNGTDIMCTNNSGLVLINVIVVTIVNVRFYHCEISHNPDQGNTFVGALVLVECSSVNITNSLVKGSNGTGLILLNCFGNISIHESEFNSNGHSTGGGGLYIEQFSVDHSNKNASSFPSTITVTNTSFTNNRATSCSFPVDSEQRFGGGITISLHDTLQHISISLIDCHFLKNSAILGGGIEVLMANSQDSFIFMDNLYFNGNIAEKGGGGLYIDVSNIHTSNYSIIVSNSTFDGNNATYGGGGALTFPVGQIEFIDCIWQNNLAHYGSALDIFPAKSETINTNVPILYCKGDSTFMNNTNWNIAINETIYRKGFGVIMVTGFKFAFSGVVKFERNSGSCIYAIGSQLFFQENSNSTFVNNLAEDGAGIALIGLSVILADDKTNFVFCNNSVERFGAGIFYHSVDKHRYVGSDRFFFHALKQNSDISFHFLGNTAPKNPRHLLREVHEQAVYSSASSLGGDNCRSTGTKCLLKEASVTVRNTSNGNCEVKNSTVNKEVRVAENKTRFDISSVEYFIPGLQKRLCVAACLMRFRTSSAGEGITIPSAYEFIDKALILNGIPGSKAELALHGQNYRDIHIKFEARLLRCPPLYKLSESQECRCYRNDEVYFATSFKCTTSKVDSYSSIKMGYWLGYDNSSDIIGSKILMAYCPTGYCRIAKDSMISLPFTYNQTEDELDRAVCDNRRGHLCGECMPGTAVYFHSRSFKCKSTKNCRWGPLLFIIAEILPVTLIFLVLILLNITLTSGGTAGLIFFAQMYESINIRLRGFSGYYFSYNFISFHHLIYQLFNFDFLELDYISFCLGKNITTLDVLVLKYLVSVYAMVLIFSTVLLIRFCGRFKCCKFNIGKVSFVKVISTFIVIVYSKCSSVSFNILWYQGLYHERMRLHAVVTLQGNLKYFGEDHLPYAVLAMLVIFVFTLPLPLIFLAYPLSNRVLSSLNIADSLLVKLLSKRLPLHKLLPLFDSFQGTFKEKYRFFSGLYFLYRITILICVFASLNNLKYLLILMQLVTMLLIHTLAWPYKNKVHNIINALLFANLAFISSLKLLMLSIVDLGSPFLIKVVNVSEIILVNLPIVVIVVYLLYNGSRKICRSYKKHRSNAEEIDSVFLSDNIRGESLDTYYRMKEIH